MNYKRVRNVRIILLPVGRIFQGLISPRAQLSRVPMCPEPINPDLNSLEPFVVVPSCPVAYFSGTYYPFPIRPGLIKQRQYPQLVLFFLKETFTIFQ